jgi:hypothetical protein
MSDQFHTHTGHCTSPSPTTEGDPTTHWIGGWVGSTAGKETSPSANRIHDSWVVRPVVRHYADCCLLVRKIIRRVQFGVLTRRWVSNNLVIYSEESFCVTKEPFAVADCLSSVPGTQRVHTPAVQQLRLAHGSAFQLLPKTIRPEKIVRITQNLFSILVYNFLSRHFSLLCACIKLRSRWALKWIYKKCG